MHTSHKIITATLEIIMYSSFAGKHSERRKTRLIPFSVFCLPSNRFRLLGFSKEAMFQEYRTDHKPGPNLPYYFQNSSKTSTANGELQFGVGPTGGELICLGML
jgi:hypothetical protein